MKTSDVKDVKPEDPSPEVQKGNGVSGKMNTKIVAGLIKAGHVLNKLTTATSEELRYHALADAIYWADELPELLPTEAENCMRLVVRYRTCLILGVEGEKYRPYWDLAQHLFPNWVGFRPERRTPSKKLKKFYEGKAKEFFQSIKEERADGEDL